MQKTTAKAPPAPATSSAPPVKEIPATDQDTVGNAAVAQGLVASGGGGDGAAAPAAPAETTYSVTLAGRTLQVTAGDTPSAVQLSGFGGSFGLLQVESLTATVSRGAGGPVGSVTGTATLLGSVECAVSGRFSGTSLTLDVVARSATPVWPGLDLASASLHIGPDGVRGSGTGNLTVPGLVGAIPLSWVQGALQAATSVVVDLPWLGSVTLAGVVSGLDFDLSAGLAALSGLHVEHAGVTLTAGQLSLVGGELTGDLSGTFADDTGLLSGSVSLAVRGTDVRVSGDVTVVADELSGPVSGVIAGSSSGEALAITLQGLQLSTAHGAVQGSVDVAWSESTGLVLSPVHVVGTLPGADGSEVTFADLTWVPGQGLSGTATLPLELLGMDWVSAPIVQGIGGELTAVLQQGELVAGQGTVRVQLAVGTVEVQASALTDAGVEASLTAIVSDLGSAVHLSQPLRIQGSHSGGQTTFEASGVAFAVALPAPGVTLRGTLAETVFDTQGLAGGADLELLFGPLGLATAHAEIRDTEIASAHFEFTEPTLRYPPDAPVLTGTFDGDISWDQGQFSGELSGLATVAGLDEEAGAGGLAFSATALPDGTLQGSFEGANISTPLLVIDRFFLGLDGTNLTSDIQVSVRDDLPFVLTGGVSASWGSAGFSVSGGFDISTPEGKYPSADGHVDVGWEAGRGLVAGGGASMVLDADESATLDASVNYSDGRLVVAAKAGAVALAEEPVVDLAMAFGGANPLKKAFDGDFVLPILGIPYLHGVAASFGLRAGQMSVSGALSGVDLDASLKPWDLLSDQSPQVSMQGTFLRSDLAMGLGLGLKADIIATVYGVSIGVKASANLQAELAIDTPTIGSNLAWSPTGELLGDLYANLPMKFRILPFLKFGAVAGISKLTVPIPGLGVTEKGAGFDVAMLPDLDLRFDWPSLLGKAGSPTPELDGALGRDPNIDGLKKGVLDGNPRLKDIVEFMILAADFMGEVVGSFDAWNQGNTEFWSSLLAGDSLETTQRRSHAVERMCGENLQYQQEIRRHHQNILALLGGGAARVDRAKYGAELGELHSNLSGIISNMTLLENGYGVDSDAGVKASYGAALSAVIKRQNLLLGL